MAKKDQYLVISNKDTKDAEFGEAIRSTTVVCYTFSKAYKVGKTLGSIVTPNISYRKALELTKVQQYCTVTDEAGSGQITIAKIKSY